MRSLAGRAVRRRAPATQKKSTVTAMIMHDTETYGLSRVPAGGAVHTSDTRGGSGNGSRAASHL